VQEKVGESQVMASSSAEEQSVLEEKKKEAVRKEAEALKRQIAQEEAKISAAKVRCFMRSILLLSLLLSEGIEQCPSAPGYVSASVQAASMLEPL